MQQFTRTEILHTSWWPIWSIYVRSENIDIRNDGTDLVYIEYYSGYKSAFYWWRKTVWNFCNHSSTDVQSTASTEILQTFLMTNLINICSFWEYRHSPWRYCSRGHWILCSIEISLKMVEQDAWFGNFVATALVMQQSTASTEILHTIMMTNLINIGLFWEYRYSKWWRWSRVHRKLF